MFNLKCLLIKYENTKKTLYSNFLERHTNTQMLPTSTRHAIVYFSFWLNIDLNLSNYIVVC